MTKFLSFWRRMRTLFIGLWFTPEPQAATRKTKDDRSQDVEDAGRWYFKRDILDKLDVYFKYAARLKRYDPDSYAVYSRVGAIVAPGRTIVWEEMSESCIARAHIGKLSFGAVFFDHSSKRDIPIRFITFKRLDRPAPNIQPSDGVIYNVTAVWDSEKAYKKARDGLGFVGDFHIAIQPDGAVRLLKELAPVSQMVGSPYANQGKIVHLRWQYPYFLRDLDWGDSLRDPQRRADFIFCCAYGIWLNCSMDVRVRVERAGLVATFGVDLLRVPYFFKDRDPVTDANGRRKKIFHIVRTHRRTLFDGKSRAVKSHFRGVRQFTWNGANVLVSMPGKHHADLLDASFGHHEFGPGEQMPTKGFVDAERLARRLDRALTA